MDRGAWRAIVHRATKSQTQLSDWHFHFHRVLSRVPYALQQVLISDLFEDCQIPRECRLQNVRGQVKLSFTVYTALHRLLSAKESACQCSRHRRWRFNPWVGKNSWSRKWQPTPLCLPRKFYEQRSLVGCSLPARVTKCQTRQSDWAWTVYTCQTMPDSEWILTSYWSIR